MLNNEYVGVYWSEEDRGSNTFMLRLGGTNEFVSKISPNDTKCFPPGSIETVKGWCNLNALRFDTLDEALEAGAQAWDAEGCHINIEAIE